MTTAAVPSFAPTAGTFVQATTSSQNVLIPTTGAPTVTMVTNHGPQTVFVALGTGAVTVSATNGHPVFAGQQVALTIGSATYLAYVTRSLDAGVSISVGT